MSSIIPVVDVIAYWIDIRVITSTFKARRRSPRTRGGRGRGAVCGVVDPEKAAVDVRTTTTPSPGLADALRDVIGKTRSPTCSKARERSATSWAVIDERSSRGDQRPSRWSRRTF
jgi:hypothetical protein